MVNLYKYLWFYGTTPKDSYITVLPINKKILVKKSQSILSAALEQGLDWPHDCKFGTCSTCKCKLIQGKTKPTSDYSYTLSQDELNNDYILACQARPTMDSVIEVELGDLEERPIAKKNNAVIKTAKLLTDDIMKIVVETDQEVEHNAIAGMWAELSIPGLDRPRSYSFASAPYNENPREFTFFIRKVPGGKFTEWLFDKNRDPDECITINGPFGSFYLREKKVPFICIAGGSGLAPIKALLEDAVKNNIERDVIFLFGARTQEDLYCLEELNEVKNKWNKNVNFDFIPVLNMEPENSNWTGARGLVTDFFEEEYIKHQGQNIAGWQAYLCGPPPMVDAAQEVLEKNGISREEVFFDKFTDSSNK